MIEPALQGEEFLADVERARREEGRLHCWWLGQSGFLLLWQGRHILLDPYLSDSLTEKYRGTGKPHVRMTRRVIPPERLGFVSLATSSHNHTDHLDAATLGPLLEANPAMEVVVPEANLDFAARRLQVEPARLRGLDADRTLELEGMALHGVPAAHEELERDALGRHKHLGYVIELGPWTVYHSGDTVPYNGLVDRLRRRPPDLALLPINGRRPERGVAGNLWGREAARIARDSGAARAIPCHYEMFEFNTESPEEFVGECRRIGQPCSVLRAGERWSSDTAE